MLTIIRRKPGGSVQGTLQGKGDRMKKLLHYAKPYVLPILICVVLLFVQAACDLNLPNLMSDIVNVGIQQGGISEQAPKAISRKGLDFFETLMTAEDKAQMEASYKTIQPGSHQAQQYEEDYPLLKTEAVAILTAEDDSTAAAAYGRSMTTLMGLLQAQAKASGQAISTDQTDLAEMDMSKLYAMGALIQTMPRQLLEQAQQAAAGSDNSIGAQMGVVMTKQLYQELGVNTDKIERNYILITGAKMLLMTLGMVLSVIGVTFCSARFAAGICRDMRHDVFQKVASFSNGEFDQFSTASLITRTTNDINQIQFLFVLVPRTLLYAPIIGVGGVVMALSKSTSMSWIIAVCVLILIGFIAIIYAIVMPKFKLVQKLVDRLNLVVREHLSGMMVIRAFGTQKYEEDRFEVANRKLTRNYRFVNRVTAFMMPAMMFLMNLMSLVIVWVGGHQIEQSAMQVGDMMAFMQYAIQIIMAFLMICMTFILMPRAAVSVNRVNEVLATEPSVRDAEQPVHLSAHPRGEIEFRDVCFRYENADEDVISDISFTARPGETTAFIGSTGSGKSTLINLIPRFYDVTKGEILFDGVDVRKIPQHELREKIGYVPQKGILFSGDIDSNLRYGAPDASEEDIALVSEIAQAKEFIQEKPEGMHTPIAQGGGNVSGGQKQRLSIARALAKKAPVYIFDDSFSALDFKTDAALRRALQEHTGDSTVLIVAQRVSTIMNAQQIIVLDEGRIVGKGTHKELLKTCPTYREIAQSQLSKEELE